MITVRCFDSFAQAAFVRDAADALNRDSARPDPFSTFKYFEHFYRCDESHPAGRGLQLWLLAAFRGQQLIGYAALRRVTRRVLGIVNVPVLGFLVTRDSDRPHVVARAEDLRDVSSAFYAHLLARHREWSLLEFRQQDGSSLLRKPAAAVDLKGHLVSDWTSLENGTVQIRWTTLRDYFQALPAKFRRNLARQLQGLLGAGRVELLGSSNPLTTPALFELYLGIEQRSWKSQAQAHIARSPLRVGYFRGLLGADQPMRVSIQLLLFDGVPIAGLINGAFRDGLYALHMAYDDRFARFAPGSATMLMGVREAIESGASFFNLLSGSGYYKSRWLADITETRDVQIYRRGSWLYWRRWVGDLLRRLRPTAGPAAPARFNAARRAASAHLPRSAPLDAAELERIGSLVAQARDGQAQFLSASAFAAVLPLERAAPLTLALSRKPESKCHPGESATPCSTRGQDPGRWISAKGGSRRSPG